MKTNFTFVYKLVYIDVLSLYAERSGRTSLRRGNLSPCDNSVPLNINKYNNNNKKKIKKYIYYMNINNMIKLICMYVLFQEFSFIPIFC